MTSSTGRKEREREQENGRVGASLSEAERGSGLAHTQRSVA